MTDDMHDDDRTDRPQPDLAHALADVRAPDSLRHAVTEAVAGAARPRARDAWRERMGLALRGRRLGAVLAGAAILIAGLALALVLASGGGSTAPRVQEVAQVALRPAAAPAPAALPGGELLAASAGPIAFPSWTRAGWRAVGERTDTIGGHELRTVLYADAADPRQRVGYAIADAELPVVGGRLVERRGAQLRVLALDGAQVVTWRRAGRTCILASRDVPLARLVALASYSAA